MKRKVAIAFLHLAGFLEKKFPRKFTLTLIRHDNFSKRKLHASEVVRYDVEKLRENARFSSLSEDCGCPETVPGHGVYLYEFFE